MSYASTPITPAAAYLHLYGPDAQLLLVRVPSAHAPAVAHRAVFEPRARASDRHVWQGDQQPGLGCVFIRRHALPQTHTPYTKTPTLRIHHTQQTQARRIGDLEAVRGRLLAQLPAAQRALILARQREAAEGQGSDKWCFPAPILAEGAFRQREREREQRDVT